MHEKLTYSATSVKILAALGAGLVKHTPLYDLPDIKRTILLPPDLKRKLRNEMESEIPAASLALPLGRFLAGHSFSVSQKNRPTRLFRKKSQPDLERLEGFEEVWAFCHRKPGAGWRMAGRFLERNVFVLLDVKDKRDIGNDYGPTVANVIAQWNAYLPNEAPLNGEWINGYLSGSHYDVDQEKQIGTP